MGFVSNVPRAAQTAKRPLLEVQAISKTVAVKTAGRASVYESSIQVSEGEVVGIIGGKCAGAPTLIDLIAGIVAPSAGQIIFKGEDVTKLSLEERQQRGIVLALPETSLIADLTVLEHIALGGASYQRPFFPRNGEASPCEEARGIAVHIGLGDMGRRRVQHLSPAQKQLLTIAVAIAARPALLLLDESGISTHLGQADLGLLVARLRQRGIAVLIAGVADCPLLDFCDRVTTMSHGRVVVENRPRDIKHGLHVASINSGRPAFLPNARH